MPQPSQQKGTYACTSVASIQRPAWTHLQRQFKTRYELFPQVAVEWGTDPPLHLCLGNGNPSTHQRIKDFHLSYWSWSGGAQQPEMKKNQRKLYVADRVWRAPEIDLEAAKAAETTLLTTSAAESRGRGWTSCGFWEVANLNQTPRGQVWLRQHPCQRADTYICLGADADPWVIRTRRATQPTSALPQM